MGIVRLCRGKSTGCHEAKAVDNAEMDIPVRFQHADQHKHTAQSDA